MRRVWNVVAATQKSDLKVSLWKTACSVFLLRGTFTIINNVHWQWQTILFKTTENNLFPCYCQYSCSWITIKLFHIVQVSKQKSFFLARVIKYALLGHGRFGSSPERSVVFTPHSPTGLIAKEPLLPVPAAVFCWLTAGWIPRVIESLIHWLSPVHFPVSTSCYDCIYWSICSPISSKTTLFDLACKHPNKKDSITAPCWQEEASKLK